MQQTTKIYENTTDHPINVLGVGTINAHDRVSVTAEFHMPVNLANYPGIIDLLAHEAQHGPAQSPSVAVTSVPVPQPEMAAIYETQQTIGSN